jgi:hypothetical protein
MGFSGQAIAAPLMTTVARATRLFFMRWSPQVTECWAQMVGKPPTGAAWKLPISRIVSG